jgi:hypothetical protein
MFWTKKNVPARIPEDSFLSVFPEEFFTGTWFWSGCRNSFRRNSCGTGIPVFTPVRRIPKDSCSCQKLLALASD